jgi:KTSC domain-containing protein
MARRMTKKKKKGLLIRRVLLLALVGAILIGFIYINTPIPVSSSTLKSVAYNPISRVLKIEFSLQVVSHYYKVPITVYAGLMRAESPGKYFWTHIKNKYKFKRQL